jgi:transmembrane protein
LGILKSREISVTSSNVKPMMAAAIPVWGWIAVRVALALPFMVSGVLKAFAFDAAVLEVQALAGLSSSALATVVAVAVVLLQLGASVLLLLGGKRAAWGAVSLAAFTLAATLLAHTGWWREGPDRIRDLMVFCEHIALVGGLALAALVSRRNSS